MSVKKWLPFLFLTSVASAAAPVITPRLPVVYVSSGTTFHADQTVTWSMQQGSTGTIDSGGVYTAPGPIARKSTWLGCATGPQDDIIHTDISNLPIQTSTNSYFHTQIDSTAVQIEPDMPENVYNNATSSTNLVFIYTPNNGGYFKILPFPDTRVENGIFSDWTRVDQHIMGVNTDSCEMDEVYKLYPIGVNTFNPCPLCNSQSGFKYTDSYTVSSPTVDAAGLSVSRLIIKGSELRDCVLNGTPIRHASRFTLSSGRIAGTFVWPATTVASASGAIPYGTRFRMKSGFPITSFSTAAQCIMQSWKTYGMFLADIGTSMHVQMAQDSTGDYTLFQAVASEFTSTNTINAWQFDAIDESSLEDLDVNSPTYQMSRVVSTNTYVQPSNFSIVVASNTTTHQMSYMPVIVQPVTIGTDKPFGYSFMAGTPQTTLNVWVHGSTDTTFTCNLGNALGAVTAAGLYTAPTSTVLRSSTAVTCTATMDPTASVSFPVIVYSTGGIRIALSAASNLNFNDASGNNWFSDMGSEWRLQGHSNCDWSYLPQNPWAVDVSSIYYHCEYVNSGSGDMVFRYKVPNGFYKVSLYYGVGGTVGFARGVFADGIDYQGVIYTSGGTTTTGDGPWTQMGLTGKMLDVYDIVGSGTNVTPGQVIFGATVTNNNFYVAIRHIVPPSGSIPSSMLNAFSLERILVNKNQFHGGKVSIKGNVKLR